jgi:hypothetical protein
VHGAGRAECRAGNQAARNRRQRDRRDLLAAVVLEGRLGLLHRIGQRYPGLQTVQRAAAVAHRVEAFRVADAATRRHPVHFAWPNQLLHAQ